MVATDCSWSYGMVEWCLKAASERWCSKDVCIVSTCAVHLSRRRLPADAVEALHVPHVVLRKVGKRGDARSLATAAVHYMYLMLQM